MFNKPLSQNDLIKSKSVNISDETIPNERMNLKTDAPDGDDFAKTESIYDKSPLNVASAINNISLGMIHKKEEVAVLSKTSDMTRSPESYERDYVLSKTSEIAESPINHILLERAEEDHHGVDVAVNTTSNFSDHASFRDSRHDQYDEENPPIHHHHTNAAARLRSLHAHIDSMPEQTWSECCGNFFYQCIIPVGMTALTLLADHMIFDNN